MALHRHCPLIRQWIHWLPPAPSPSAVAIAATQDPAIAQPAAETPHPSKPTSGLADPKAKASPSADKAVEAAALPAAATVSEPSLTPPRQSISKHRRIPVPNPLPPPRSSSCSCLLLFQPPLPPRPPSRHQQQHRHRCRSSVPPIPIRFRYLRWETRRSSPRMAKRIDNFHRPETSNPRSPLHTSSYRIGEHRGSCRGGRDRRATLSAAIREPRVQPGHTIGAIATPGG